MTIDEAIKLSNRALALGYTASLDGFDTATKLGIEALHRLLTIRSFNINQAILPLPHERPIEDLAPSALRKQKLRESPLGREPLKLSECPFERLRDYPGCYEDCPDVEQCPHPKKAKA